MCDLKLNKNYNHQEHGGQTQQNMELGLQLCGFCNLDQLFSEFLNINTPFEQKLLGLAKRVFGLQDQVPNPQSNKYNKISKLK